MRKKTYYGWKRCTGAIYWITGSMKLDCCVGDFLYDIRAWPHALLGFMVSYILKQGNSLMEHVACGGSIGKSLDLVMIICLLNFLVLLWQIAKVKFRRVC